MDTQHILGDRLATVLGWWTFSFAPSWAETVLLYIPAGLVAGAAFGVVGGRVSRRGQLGPSAVECNHVGW